MSRGVMPGMGVRGTAVSVYRALPVSCPTMVTRDTPLCGLPLAARDSGPETPPGAVAYCCAAGHRTYVWAAGTTKGDAP